MIVVSQNDEEVQVMDKKTYAITVIKKPKKIIFSEEQISVIRYEDSFFLLPELIEE
jgi:NMD protein affecting ribosome stability and mRNA decay